jgi:ferredoxin
MEGRQGFMTVDSVIELLPEEIRDQFEVGICDPRYIDEAEPVYVKIRDKWSAKAYDIFEPTKSIIVLLHFSPVSLDYSVENHIYDLGVKLFEKHGVRSQLVNDAGECDPLRLVGTEFGPSAATFEKMVLLKELAYFAGIGQYGRNSLIISPRFGSDLKIQALFVDGDFKFGEPKERRLAPCCEDCDICIVKCPSESITAEYRLKDGYCLASGEPDMVLSKVPIDFFRKDALHRPKGKPTLCRICQAYCPANAEHYVDDLVIVKERNGVRLRKAEEQ